jgi:hypothetical protein
LELREVDDLMNILLWWAVAFLILLTLLKVVDALRAIELAISEARLDQRTSELAALHRGQALAGTKIPRRWP